MIYLPIRPVLTVALAFVSLGSVSAAETYTPPKAEQIIAKLKPGHPRLMLTPQRLVNIKQSIEQDPIAAKIYQSSIKSADLMLDSAASKYELPDGRRLLSISSRVLDRVRTLAFAYQMTRDRRYADRAWAELDAAAKFQDWHPDHFLDTAVMTHAFAIGYDWLWDQWTPSQREILRHAIVELGLKPALKVYESKGGWPKVTYNWNQVCNGGIGLGALAIADLEPELAGKILAQGMASLPLAMKAYLPDGGGSEGVTYWNFGSAYNVLLLDSLETALGTDFGLSGVGGFQQSGDYQIYISGTKRISFDFSDCKLTPVSAPQHFWMARKYNIPRYAWFRYAALRDSGRGDLMDLIWFDPDGKDFDFKDMPLDRHFRGAEAASMRDSWIDGKGFIAALQGGSTGGTHRHLDLGSFILEADGVRWILDSGVEHETYQKHANHVDRWDFYRTRAEGHNTLVFNPGPGADQNIVGIASFGSFVSQPEQATASIDLTNAYETSASKVVRSFRLTRNKDFAVADEITCLKPADIWSYFHTAADVTLGADKRSATLNQGGKSIHVRLDSPANAVFQVLAAEPGPESPHPTKQASNKGRCKLAIHLTGVESIRIAVRFEH